MNSKETPKCTFSIKSCFVGQLIWTPDRRACHKSARKIKTWLPWLLTNSLFKSFVHWVFGKVHFSSESRVHFSWPFYDSRKGKKRKLAPWNLTNLLHFSIARQKKKYCIKDAIYAYFWLLLMHVNRAKSSSSEMEPTSNHILVLKSWSISPPQFKISRYINSQTILEERNAKILLIFIPW